MRTFYLLISCVCVASVLAGEISPERGISFDKLRELEECLGGFIDLTTPIEERQVGPQEISRLVRTRFKGIKPEKPATKEAFLEAATEAVRWYALRHGLSASDAEDAAQEAAVKLIHNVEGIWDGSRVPDSVELRVSYMFRKTIAEPAIRKIALEKQKNEQIVEAYIQYLKDIGVPAYALDLREFELEETGGRENLHRILELLVDRTELTPRQRDAIVSHYGLFGKTPEEYTVIGERWGTTTRANASVAAMNGKEKLRERVAKDLAEALKNPVQPDELSYDRPSPPRGERLKGEEFRDWIVRELAARDWKAKDVPDLSNWESYVLRRLINMNSLPNQGANLETLEKSLKRVFRSWAPKNSELEKWCGLLAEPIESLYPLGVSSHLILRLKNWRDAHRVSDILKIRNNDFEMLSHDLHWDRALVRQILLKMGLRLQEN